MEFFFTFLILLIFGFIFYKSWRDGNRTKMVQQGRAAYFVKVAASGKGRVYHIMSCGKCIAWHEMTIFEARNRLYSPCATCGGRGQYRLLENRELDRVTIEKHSSEKNDGLRAKKLLSIIDLGNPDFSTYTELLKIWAVNFEKKEASFRQAT